jgi:hypothetical protein
MADYAPAWMRGTPLEQIWLQEWFETGDGQLAMEAVRRSPAYDEILAGNRREDGSLRYDENTYFGLIESYEDSLLSVNLNPDIFREFFSENIEGLVSPTEFAGRVNRVYERVIQSIPETAAWAADIFGLDLSVEGILAMAVDPRIGEMILDRRIAMSEVGGAAASKNFTVGADLAEKMVTYGLDTAAESQDYFAQAKTIVPALEVLSRRHADPDDDFDLTEFTNATLFGDPEQRRRMRRLMDQERASFGPDRSLTIAQNQEGSLTGLFEK